MRTSKARKIWGMGLAAIAVTALTVAAGSRAYAGIEEAELSLTGGTGVPGGTVSVTLALDRDVADEAVSAGIDLVFPAETLEFFVPVANSCAVASRLEDTHAIGGRLLEPGVLNLEVFVSGTPDPLPPLGNGDIATCDFLIKEGVPTGTVAVEIDSPFLGDKDGMEIPVVTRGGSIVIVDQLPTATPTVTSTPQSTATATVTGTATNTPPTQATSTSTATATVTDTAAPGTPTATATATSTGSLPPTATSTPTSTGSVPPTATSTATRTHTIGPKTPTDNDDGCNVVSPREANGSAAMLLLLPAMLLWMRRRS
jgi:hypothetical protein